ncbi:hypothetical protein ES705_33056 [subsurface metagenome]
MRKFSIILIAITLISCCRNKEKEDEVILHRIEYIFNLKTLLNEEIWTGFSDKKFDLPLVYYADSTCYVTNPTEKFINTYIPTLIFKNEALKIYKTSLIDSIPFHMSVGITFGDTTADYNYKSPFINCSSVEITQKNISDVLSTEQWATMIIHEYFHGFQFKHPTFLNYFEQNILGVQGDSLKNMYKNNTWFSESIDEENDLLLKAIQSDSATEVINSIQRFFVLRDQRREKTKQFLNSDIKKIEEGFETMEGTARYFEFSLYNKFATEQPDSKLVQSDTLYHSNDYFKDYDIEKDQWLYLTGKTSYYYAIGFNMSRLLDKLKVEYKSRLFNENELTLEKILRKQIKNGG